MDSTVIWSGVVVIIGSLAAAVTTLWRNAENRYAKLLAQQEAKIKWLQQKVDECESDRSELRERIVRLETTLKLSVPDENESQSQV